MQIRLLASFLVSYLGLATPATASVFSDACQDQDPDIQKVVVGIKAAAGTTDCAVAETKLAEITKVTVSAVTSLEAGELLAELPNLSDLKVDRATTFAFLPKLVELKKFTALGGSLSTVAETEVFLELPKLTELTLISVVGAGLLDGDSISFSSFGLSPICQIPLLTWLNLSGAKIHGLECLATLTNLKMLGIGQTGVTDLSFLSTLPNLEILYIERLRLTDEMLAPIAHATNLVEIGAWGNQFSNPTAFAALTKVRSLDLRDNPIADYSPLFGMTDLIKLDVGGTKLSDLTILDGHWEKLERFGANSNLIVDASPLGRKSSLKKLWIDGNKISDVTFLNDLPNLAWASLAGNQITDISSLEPLPALIYLNVAQNPLTEQVCPLANLEACKF